jgi:hypothetical protein
MANSNSDLFVKEEKQFTAKEEELFAMLWFTVTEKQKTGNCQCQFERRKFLNTATKSLVLACLYY